jgi:large conductance mechanosensitive channel
VVAARRFAAIDMINTLRRAVVAGTVLSDAVEVGHNPVPMKGFRKFILRGNLVDLAVAVVIGSLFSGLIQQFVKSFVTPLIALVGGQPSFDNLKFTINKSDFTYGAFLTTVISFVVASAVVYFLVVLPVARLRGYIEGAAAANEKPCPECTRSIPIEARRCPECTSVLTGPGVGG